MPYAQSFKNIVLEMFKGDTEALADFQLTARKTGSTTAATKAVAVTKRQATRKALGTKGSRQKKAAIKALKTQPAPAPAPAPVSAPGPAPAPAAPAIKQ
jgi:hypothetical protein